MQNSILEKIAKMKLPKLDSIKSSMSGTIGKGLLLGTAQAAGLAGAGYIGNLIGKHREGTKLTNVFREFNQEENKLITDAMGQQSLEAQQAVAAAAYHAGQKDLMNRIQAASAARK